MTEEPDDIPHNSVSLTEATFEQLWQEMANRCRTAAILFSREVPGNKDDSPLNGFLWTGCVYSVIGMLDCNLRAMRRERLQSMSTEEEE